MSLLLEGERKRRMMLGNRLKELRISHQLTQEELAKQLYVTRQTISNWENNKGQPELENIILLSEVFQVSINELLNQENFQKQTSKKIEVGKRAMLILIAWSVIMLVVQLILHPYSMQYILLYSLGGLFIVTDYLRRTKRIANLYG